MLLKLVSYKQQNIRTDIEIALWGTLTSYHFIHVKQVNPNALEFYLPQILFEGRYYHIIKERATLFS